MERRKEDLVHPCSREEAAYRTHSPSTDDYEKATADGSEDPIECSLEDLYAFRSQINKAIFLAERNHAQDSVSISLGKKCLNLKLKDKAPMKLFENEMLQEMAKAHFAVENTDIEIYRFENYAAERTPFRDFERREIQEIKKEKERIRDLLQWETAQVNVQKEALAEKINEINLQTEYLRKQKTKNKSVRIQLEKNMAAFEKKVEKQRNRQLEIPERQFPIVEEKHSKVNEEELRNKISELEKQLSRATPKEEGTIALQLARLKTQLTNLRSQKTLKSSVVKQGLVRTALNSVQKRWDNEDSLRAEELRKQKDRMNLSMSVIFNTSRY